MKQATNGAPWTTAEQIHPLHRDGREAIGQQPTLEGLRCHEAHPVVNPGRYQPQQRLQQPDHGEPGAEGAIDGVEAEGSSGGQNPGDLRDHGVRAVDMLQHIDADHHIETSGGERKLLRQSHPVINLQTRHGRMAPGRFDAGAGTVDAAQAGAAARQELTGVTAAAADIQDAKISPLGNKLIEAEKAQWIQLTERKDGGGLLPPTGRLLIVE